MDVTRKSAFIRAARAWLGEDQQPIAAAIGVAWNTLIAAERGTMSDKTWDKASAYYASRGLHLLDGGGQLVVMID